MSTIVILQQRDGVHLITGAGTYDSRDGTLVAVHSKVIELPGGVVLAWRGASGNWPVLLAKQLLNYLSFEAMLYDLPARMEELHSAAMIAQAEDAPPGGYLFEVYLAGFSRSAGRFGCAFLTSRVIPMGSGPESAAPPFTLREVPGLAAFPGPAQPLDQILPGERDPNGNWIDELDPAVAGLALIEAQRKTPGAFGFYCAGGFAELTSITRSGVTRKRLVEWDDEIGKPVDPGLSDEERRAGARYIAERLGPDAVPKWLAEAAA